MSLQLEASTKTSASGVCTQCLKFLALNVSGPGIVQTIYQNKEHPNFEEDGTEIDPTIVIDIPIGNQRFIQLVAVYRDTTTGTIVVNYGDVSVDLEAGEVTVSLPMTSLGTFQGGRIVGRYLTGTNAGPTGGVNIKLIPKPGMSSMTLLKSSIVNGWFNFFASQNFSMSYEMNDGTILFNDVRLNRDYLPANLTSNTQVARVTRPTSYYRQTSPSVWTLETEDSADIVYGFFFSPGVSDPNKKVCKTTSSVTMTNLSTSANGSGGAIVYNPMASPVAGSSNINVYGGVTSGCTSSIQQYTANEIHLVADQFDGRGNDHAESMKGAFTFFYDSMSGHIEKYSSPNLTQFDLELLPGVYGVNALFDGVRLFQKTQIVSSDEDKILCSADSLLNYGFSEISGITSTLSGSRLSVSIPNAISPGIVVACPVKSNILLGLGGMVVWYSPPQQAYLTITQTAPLNFGSVSVGAGIPATQTLTVYNAGLNVATSITASGLSNPFSFSGGTYPGNSGTCGAVLAGRSSCTIALSFMPASVGTFNGSFNIYYNNGNMMVSISKSVTGTGVP